MTEDATLSAFLGSGDEESDAEPKDAVTDRTEEDSRVDEDTTDTGQPDTATPAVSTYVWGTYTCDDCAETVTRAWRDDDGLVCPACKDW